jgi:MoxR-like ATPase
VHHPDLDEELAAQAIAVFYELRALQRLRKRPSTSELIDWIGVLRAAGVTTGDLESELPFVGALLKKEQDLLALAEAMPRVRRPRA